MNGFFLGFLAFLGALALLRFVFFLGWRRRWLRYGHPVRGYAGPRPPGGRFLFRSLFARLDTTPGQEKVLLSDAAALREELAAARADWEAIRHELAELLGETQVEPARLDALLAKPLARLDALRRKIAEAMTRFHASLDDAQRKALAELVRDGRLFSPAYARHRGRC